MLTNLSVDPTFADKFKIISINDPEDKLIFGEVYPRHRNVLSLQFHDITPVNINNFQIINERYVLFNEEDADRVIDFLTDCVETDNIIVHCFAGISRSGAIGTFAREMFNLDYERFKRMNPNILPNWYILKILTERYRSG